MDGDYKIPPQTRIGHVHLKVANLQRAIDFYYGLLGFKVAMLYKDNQAFLLADSYHKHIGLNTWYSKNAPPASREGVGLSLCSAV